MSSDIEFEEPLHRACSEPSLPSIEPKRDVTVMHAELDLNNERRPIYSSPTPRSGIHQTQRKMKERGLIADFQLYDKSISTPHGSPTKLIKRHSKLTYDVPDNEVHNKTLRRTESRLDLKCPNQHPRPRSFMKQPSPGAKESDSSASPKRKQSRISQEKIVKSAGPSNLRLTPSPPRSPQNAPSKRGSTGTRQRVSCSNKSSNLLSPSSASCTNREPSTRVQQPAKAKCQSSRKIRHLERSPNVKFYVRFSPSNNETTGCQHLVVDGNQKTLYVRALQDMVRLHPLWTYWQFNTDGLLVEVTQDMVFRTVLAPRLGYAYEGIDLVLMAFGEPGTGKSYTLTGLNKSYADRGLIPRALDEVVGKRRPKGYDLKISITYVEFSENRCFNLLAPGKKPVEVDSSQNRPIEVPSSIEALDLLFGGEVKRKFEKASLNCASAVYTIHIKSKALNANDPHTSYSKIHFVDVPGIETLWSSQKSDPCAISANLDKLSIDVTSQWAYYLSRDIAKPSENRNTAVYGTSSLVAYLNRSFTHGSVMLLGMIKPDGDKLQKTLSTLRFGCKVARLHTGLLDHHQESSAARKTAILKNKIDDLKAQIETSKLLSFGEYDRFNVCQQEAQHIARLVKTYIQFDSPNSVSETCLLSTAKHFLLVEEIRRQFHAESDFIASHFKQKSSLVVEEIQSNSNESIPKKPHGPYKRKTRGSKASVSQSFEANDFKDIADPINNQDESKSVNTHKGAGGSRKSKSPGSRKSVASRKSMGPRKSKAGAGKTPKPSKHKVRGKASTVKTEPLLSTIDEEFLDRGRKDKVWLLNEFLLRHKDVADENEANDRSFETARDAKISKAKDLDEYRASLGRTRIWLCHLQSKRNLMDLEPLGDPGAITEEETIYLQKEKETREKIVTAIDELGTLHSLLTEATQTHKSYREKLLARFKAWINEIYVDEPYEREEEYMTASKLDKEIPKQTLSSSKQLEPKTQVDYLKLQESFFHKKLPI